MKIRRAVVMTGAIAAASGYLIGRLHRVLDFHVSSPPAEESMTDSPTAKSNSHESRVPDQTVTAFRWHLALVVVIASGLLTGIAAAAAHFSHTLLAGVALLVALALSSYVIRGPRQRTRTAIAVIASILVAVQINVVFAATLLGIDSNDPQSLLEVTTLGIIGLGIVLFLIVTWLPGWPYAEPLATGIIAISLAALCVPGLGLITKSLQYPKVNGQVMLFATGSQTQSLTLSVTVNSIDGPPTSESFGINTSEAKRIRWALLLVGDARLDSGQASRDVKRRVIRLRQRQDIYGQPAYTYIPAQLFWGNVSKSSADSAIFGESHATFADATGGQWAVQLPDYEPGILPLVDDANVTKLINTALGGESTFRSSQAFTININGDTLASFDSVERASPSPLASSDSPPGPISWISHDFISPRYVVKDEAAVGKASNILFVFAILLGAAGAALLASIQSMIHVLSRKADASKRGE